MRREFKINLWFSLFIYFLSQMWRISFLEERRHQFIFHLWLAVVEWIATKEYLFKQLPWCRSGGNKRSYFCSWKKVQSCLPESALISQSKIDVKYCAIWESGPIHSKHIYWQLLNSNKIKRSPSNAHVIYQFQGVLKNTYTENLMITKTQLGKL